jgi:hypothetical protein
MKVLVACEESQTVCKAFRELGHEAYSCDIIECSGGHPEWHILGDALQLINGNCTFQTMDGQNHTIEGKWDMIIAFPPCTYLTNAGARHLWKGGVLNQERYAKGLEGKKFFMEFYNADCPKIAIENPTPSKIYELPKHSQVIQPYQFGHPFTKRTQLWLKGLPNLEATDLVEPERHGVRVVHTLASTMTNIVECLPKTGQETAARHSLALQKLWQNSGEEKLNEHS